MQNIRTLHANLSPGLPASFSFTDLNGTFAKGRYWKFVAVGDPTVATFVSRDADSYILDREAAAVKEWLASDRWFHVMRDTPTHKLKILGGLWGVKAYQDVGET